jgi:hypothetical protein
VKAKDVRMKSIQKWPELLLSGVQFLASMIKGLIRFITLTEEDSLKAGISFDRNKRDE